MLSCPESWELREGQQCYAFYPAASLSRPWQAMCRIPWGRQQWIVPLYVQRCSPLRRFPVEWERDAQN